VNSFRNGVYSLKFNNCTCFSLVNDEEFIIFFVMCYEIVSRIIMLTKPWKLSWKLIFVPTVVSYSFGDQTWCGRRTVSAGRQNNLAYIGYRCRVTTTWTIYILNCDCQSRLVPAISMTNDEKIGIFRPINRLNIPDLLYYTIRRQIAVPY